jgi:hypothetical protein
MLTTAQLQTLKTAILADPVLAAFPMNSDGDYAIAQALNVDATPEFVVWRTSVETKQIMENGFVWTAVDAMAVGKSRIWDWMASMGTINPSKVNVRQGLADAFGAASAMGLAIMPHLKRSATRVEKLLATGTGTTAVPGTMTFEGNVSYAEVGQARNLA